MKLATSVSEPHSFPEPARLYVGFDNKVSLRSDTSHSSHPRSLSLAISLLSLQLSPPVKLNFQPVEFTDLEHSDEDSLDPSRCGSLSQDEIEREMLETSKSPENVVPCMSVALNKGRALTCIAVADGLPIQSAISSKTSTNHVASIPRDIPAG